MEVFWILALAGFLVSILSAIESRVQWISSFCSFFGEGCRRTQDFSLFRIPISLWGIGYYAALAFLFYMAEPWVFWLVMAGFGFELTFLWIMIAIRAVCIFCLFNAVVIGGLVWLYFDSALIWKTAAVALISFVMSKYLIFRENMSRISAKELVPEPAKEKKNAAGTRMIAASGPADARVVVVEFSDLFCPACRKSHETTRKIREAYKDRIRWVFKDFPLEMHKGSKVASEAAHCAGEEGQDKFWKFQDMVYKAEIIPISRD